MRSGICCLPPKPQLRSREPCFKLPVDHARIATPFDCKEHQTALSLSLQAHLQAADVTEADLQPPRKLQRLCSDGAG